MNNPITLLITLLLALVTAAMSSKTSGALILRAASIQQVTHVIHPPATVRSI